MLDRRAFLHGVLGLALGSPVASAYRPAESQARERLNLTEDLAHRQYLADIANCDLQVLGLPRRPSLIAEGFLPIVPNRVLVVDDAELHRFRRRHSALRRHYKEEQTRFGEQWAGISPIPSTKLDVCVGLMDRLTAHYRRPDLLPRWTHLLLRWEQLGSTGIGNGFGLLHDFQPSDTIVRTDNGVVDWWLVLLPGGVDWQALDDRPVHFMVGPVMADRQPGNDLRVMEALCRGLRPLVMAEGFDPAAWAVRLAGLPAAEAAREVNAVVARGLVGSRMSRLRAG